MAVTAAPPNVPESAHPTSSAVARIPWFDVLRGLVMLWILLFHFAADTGPLQPAGPDLVDRASDSLTGVGNLLISNGYYTVHLFLFISGAGLAISRSRGLAHGREQRRARPRFWRDRLAKIGIGYALALPLIFGALGAYAVWRALDSDTGMRLQFEHGASLGWQPYVIDQEKILAAVLFLPRLLGGEDAYQAPPATAWFLVPLLGLYVLFPLLWWLRQKLGPIALVVLCFAIAYGFRELGLEQWDWRRHWLQVLAPARLAEFGLGVAVGPLLWKLRSPWLLLALPLAGYFWLQGVHDEGGDQQARVNLLIAAGLPALVIALSIGLTRVPKVSDGLGWIGRRTLALLLVQDVVRFAITTWLTTGHSLGARAPVGALFVAACMLLAAGFGRVSGRVERRLGIGERAGAHAAAR